MLTHLHIRDIAIIAELELDLRGGMTALTGETGAGKSKLVDALGLALGARAASGVVRHRRVAGPASLVGRTGPGRRRRMRRAAAHHRRGSFARLRQRQQRADADAAAARRLAGRHPRPARTSITLAPRRAAPIAGRLRWPRPTAER